MYLTLKEAVIEALSRLGGIGHRDEIYETIISDNLYDFSSAKTPVESISKILQTYSLSSAYGIEDIFYNVYGISARKGVWALVDQGVENMNLQLTADDEAFSEGKKLLRKHLVRERNSKLIQTAKQEFKSKNNSLLFCEVCGFMFSEKYGELGEGFIEAHHIKPLSEMQDEEITKVEDIVMLCSNCHSMIHRKRPWITKENLKELLKK